MKNKSALYGVLIFICLFGFILTSHSANYGQNIIAVSPKAASDLITQHKGDSEFVILDIRTPGEFQSGHLPNAILIDFYANTFADEINRLDRQKTYLLHCRSGNRSTRSLSLFEKLKFQKIYHLSSGINGWKAEGLPLSK